MRISNQIIEELDEQLTLSQLTQSKMKDYANRPKINDFFSAMDVSNKKPVTPSSRASPGESVFNQYPTSDDDVFITTPNPSLASKTEKDHPFQMTGTYRLIDKFISF